jgi:acyl-CoA reductase-like NAD-dependent aldehyde dehydrogenase
VFLFGANEVLKDDGQIFSCDLTHHGKKRRVYTQRAPLLGVITAITPFNHPMNQVAHKVVPSVATNNRMVLKPSEKVPFSAILFADILYEAGLPPEMLSVVTGDPREIADELITNPNMSTWSPSPAVWRSASTSRARPVTGAWCWSSAATTRSS